MNRCHPSAIRSRRPMPHAKKIKVLLVDDHTMVREALRSLLEAVPGIAVVGDADNGRSAIDQVLSLHPDVLLMDIGMPRLNGLEAARQIRRMVPATRILILSASGADFHIRQVVECGADGYLLKDSSGDVLAAAIQDVVTGKKFFSRAISHRMKVLFQEKPYGKGSDEKKSQCLTAREAQVLQLIAEGGANKQIAVELDISIKTVEKHRQNLMEKLNIHDTATLTRYAIASGIVDNNILQTALV